jgi:NADH-quinone oxidoreductase subunit J
MQLSQILFAVFGTLTLAGGITATVMRRNIFYASLALAISCLGVVGLLALLEAWVIAALQLIVFVGGIAALMRFAPPPLKEMTHPGELGFGRQWRVAAVLAVVLCGVLAGTAISHNWSAPPANPASASLPGFILPLIAVVVMLLVALVGAVKIVRRQ